MDKNGLERERKLRKKNEAKIKNKMNGSMGRRRTRKKMQENPQKK